MKNIREANAANLLEDAAVMVMEDDSQAAYDEGLLTLTNPAILGEVDETIYNNQAEIN